MGLFSRRRVVRYMDQDGSIGELFWNRYGDRVSIDVDFLDSLMNNIGFQRIDPESRVNRTSVSTAYQSHSTKYDW